VVEGDSYHRFERGPIEAEDAKALRSGVNFSHFGPEANVFDKLEELSAPTAKTGKRRRSATTCQPRRKAASHNGRLAPAGSRSVHPLGARSPQTPCFAVSTKAARMAWGRGL